jgi:enoyl-CoA hydratase
MPEVSIGLFPDVAASYFLSRCPGATGLYVGLTGVRVSGADALYLGLADHFVRSETLDHIIALLAESGDVAAALSKSQIVLQPSGIKALRPEIDACFDRASVAEILAALKRSTADWAGQAERAMLAASPTSLEITFRAIHEGRDKSLQDCLITDFRIAQRLMQQADYFEGTRALIVDKDRTPRWSPTSLAEVDPSMIDLCFAPLQSGEMTFA